MSHYPSTETNYLTNGIAEETQIDIDKSIGVDAMVAYSIIQLKSE